MASGRTSCPAVSCSPRSRCSPSSPCPRRRSAAVTSSSGHEPGIAVPAVRRRETCRTPTRRDRFTVSGTVVGLPGDQVDLRCAYRRADGAVNPASRRCGLPAVPRHRRDVLRRTSRSPARAAAASYALPTSGGIPADLTPFAGPRYFGATREHEHDRRRRPERRRRCATSTSARTSPTLDVDITSIGDGRRARTTWRRSTTAVSCPYLAQELCVRERRALRQSSDVR